MRATSSTRLVLGLARREVIERLRSRAFRIATAFVLLGAVAAVVLPNVLTDDETTDYQVGWVGDSVEEVAAAMLGQSLDATVVVETYPDRAAGEAALDDDLDVLVVVDGSELVWDQEVDAELEIVLRGMLTQIRLQARASELGLSTDDLSELLAPVPIDNTILDDAGDEVDEDDDDAELAIATIGMIFLFMSIAFFGSHILLSVVEEKQNRVVEVLLAHIDSRHLLLGKIVGHGALGLAQMVCVATIVGVGLAVTEPIELSARAYGAIASVVLWFILGFALYSILYGALGALASRVEDAQMAIGPVITVLLIGYFLSFYAAENPDSSLAVIGSFLPPTAPLMMPLRTALTDVAPWQIVLAVAIEVAAIVGLVRLGGRLYQGAILHVGRKLSLREAWHATR